LRDGGSEGFGVVVGVVLVESALNEALRRGSSAIFLGADFFGLVEEGRYGWEDIRVRFCWVVARTMHCRHIGNLKGVRGRGRVKPLSIAAAIVLIYSYVSSQLALLHAN
jgi:hypothetical protein